MKKDHSSHYTGLAHCSTKSMMSVLGILLLTTVFMQETDANPLLGIAPPEFIFDLSPSLDINCTFSINETPTLAAIVSLIIAKSNDSGQTFTDLASITSFAPYKVNLLTNDKTVTEDGFFDDAGESYLSLSWKTPSENQAGIFACSAHGFDSTGHTEVITVTAQSHGRKGNAEDYANVIRDISIALKEITTEFNNFSRSVKHNDTDIDAFSLTLTHTVDAIDANVQKLQQEVIEARNYTKNLDQNVSNINPICLNRVDFCEETVDNSTAQKYLCKPFFQSYVLVHTGSKYYISEKKPLSSQLSIDRCIFSGARLAEIDDLEEYHAIQKFLNATHGIEYVLIAGTDAAVEGQWVFQSSGQKVPFLDWAPGEPAGGSAQNCLFLNGPSGWKMSEEPCSVNQGEEFVDTARFLCESPSN